jgi:type I restriction enzyme S subunit
MSTSPKTVILSDIADLIGTQVDPREQPQLLYIGLEHVAPSRFIRIGGGLAADVQSSKFAFKQGDVLYGKLRPYLDKAVLAEQDGVCTTELLVLKAKEGVDSRFLICVVHCREFIEHAISGTTGSQHPRTSWHRISEFEFPAFSPEEQSKIADIIWAAHNSILACEEATSIGTELRRAAMRELFTRGLRGETQKETEIGLIPESWPLETIGAHFTVVSGGTPSRGNVEYWDGGTIPWVKTAEVNYGLILATDEHITPAGLANSAAKMLPVGTLLMAMYGQGVTRGRVALLGIEAACNQACAAINAHDDEVDPRYLFHFLTFRYEAIRQMAHGGQQQNLNLEIVRDLPLAFPKDNNTQRDIVEMLDAIDRKIALHMRKRAVLEDLFKTLLHKLMSGEIRVTDLDLSTLGHASIAGVAA